MKVAVVLGLTVTTLGASLYVGPRPLEQAREVVVQRGPFVESIVETGRVNAARVMTYGAPVGAVPSKIIELAPEGAHVGPGDVLVRLDTAPLEQMLARELEGLTRAEAELRASREEAEAGAGAARLALMEAEAALAESEREVARTRTAVEDLRPMLPAGFITRAELERAEQALARAEEQRRLAAARLALRESARSNRSGIPRTGRIEAAESQVRELRARAANIRAQIALSTIRSDRAGLLVYRELFFGSERRRPQVGDEALPNQPLVSVPDASEFTVETRVRETDLHRVAASQRVTVRVDAYPDVSLPGRIDVIGALAQDDLTTAGTKFFPLVIRLDRADARLRPGMTAQVEIEVTSIPSALLVPIEALQEDDRGAYGLVVRDGGVERRTLVVWARSETHVAIRSGLSAGDRLKVPGGAR